MGKNVYISDCHFGHFNIIKYCDRPFKTSEEMDRHMWSILKKFDEDGYNIYFLGDWGFQLTVGGFKNWQNHVMIYGNHDGFKANEYKKWFGTVVGCRGTWKNHSISIVDGDNTLLLSHEPQFNLNGCDFNLYGHHHNNMTRFPERFQADYGWIFGSNVHYNVSVELLNYTPRTINEIRESYKLIEKLNV